ncbi:MAG: radical SAM family heme chaperone HemW [Candidatus Omnitrophica bacterium]|nr:radical SAM family heme chaperone HemW [Candidatus Omnitrophota bacterium]
MKTLYIHIPFCQKKCFYCSFVVSVGQQGKAGLYLDGLEKESKQYYGEKIRSVYIGGGTPTSMSQDELKRLFSIIYKNYHIEFNAEWTVEANPEGLESSKLKIFKDAGVNRISLGVQSLNNKYLRCLGRNHDAETAVAAYERIKKAGFDNINVDMMFAFPHQTIDELQKDVEAVMRLESDHLSLYTLTIEGQSRFYTRKIRLADDQYQAAQYELVCDLLTKAGYEQYEISNFAKPSKCSQHNLNYWQGGEYIGLGVGAHSHIQGERFWNTSRFNDYLSLMQEGDSAREGFEVLTPFEQMKEVVLFGLRMNRGVSIEQTEKRFGCFLSDEQKEKISQFIQNGFLVQEDGCLKTSSKGRLVLDELCARLV